MSTLNMLYASRKFSFLAAVAVLAFATLSRAQTPESFRAKYGDPQLRVVEGRRVIQERYLARPNIQMTVKYARTGQACEVLLEPVPGSRPTEGRVEHAPTGDYMDTSTVVDLFNELAPIEQRGKLIGQSTSNGGDPEMKLHHPGCWGLFIGTYRNITIVTPTWCWGGTFYAAIYWKKIRCRGKPIELQKTTG